MGMKTGIIKYNITDRGRKHTGQPRAFDAAEAARIINSPAVQERVKTRGMTGYFGHWPRVRFGMNPVEGGIVDGKHVSVEPAFVTTKLSASPDGTVEHETEFLDTNSGRLAERLWKSRKGGWSSAIDFRRVADRDVPVSFYGFDYVLEPNFNENRGYALDGVSDATLSALDEVSSYFSALDAVWAHLDEQQTAYDALKQAYEMQAATLERMQLENVQLLSIASKGGRMGGGAQVALDGLHVQTFGTSKGGVADASAFLHDELVQREQPEHSGPNERKTEKLINRAFRV